MYDDILEDPEVQAVIDKYDGDNKNDAPLDEFGNLVDKEADDDKTTQSNDNADTENESEDNKKTSVEPVELDEDSLEEELPEPPEVDYTPQTEFAKTLDLSKLDDGYQKYVLAKLEPLSIKDEDGNEIRAYTADDIPKDFKFANQQEVAKVGTELARLEAAGENLKKEYEDILKSRETTIAENEERIAEREGLTEAIENGEFPKIELDDTGKVDPDSKINILADDIIAFQHKTNEGRTASRKISFDTALNRFRRDNPERFKELDNSLSKEDEERENYARRTARSAQRTGVNTSKSAYDNLSRAEFDELLNDPEFDVRKLLK